MCHMSMVCQWPLQNVLCSGVSLWNHSRRYEEIQEALLATCVLEMVVGNTIMFVCLVNPRNVLEVKHWEKHLLGL